MIRQQRENDCSSQYLSERCKVSSCFLSNGPFSRMCTVILNVKFTNLDCLEISLRVD